MGTRYLAETWLDALARLQRWDGDVAVSWVQARNRDRALTMLGATIRGGVKVGEIDYDYGRLQIRSRMQSARFTAQNLREGRVFREMGNREFRDVPASEGQAYWQTSGTRYGAIAPIPTPSYYAVISIADMDLVSQAQLSEPVFGSLPPYYPSGTDAVLDVLYGVTNDQIQRDTFNQIVIHLPYVAALIEQAVYVDGEGMAITIGGESAETVKGHRLQALWKIQAAEQIYQRASKVLTEPGQVVLPMEAEPHVFHASLQDPSGLMVDTVDHHRQYTAEEIGLPLLPEALPEALDFVASVWQNVTRTRLLNLRQVTAASQLGMSASAREDFVSRMSALADVFKAIQVDQSLYDQAAAKGLDPEATLARVRLATQRLLSAPDLNSASAAISILQNIVQVRTALQHEKTKMDLPTALAKLGIPFPAPWADIWERIRRRAVGALRELRQALESAAAS